MYVYLCVHKYADIVLYICSSLYLHMGEGDFVCHVRIWYISV